MAIAYAPKPESTSQELRETAAPVWRDVLDRLLDRSGMWPMGDGGSGGPKPELADNESRGDDE